MNIELHVLERGVDRGPLPSVASVALSPVFCDYGGLSFKYPRDGKKFATLLKGKDEIEVVPWINGVPHPELGGLVQEISGDDVAEVGVIDYSGVGYLRLLYEARVYPFGWPDFDPKAPSWKFTNATAGEVLGALGLAARNRGAILDVAMDSFTNELDSNGQPWTKQVTFEVKPGVTLVDVLQSLHDNGLCEFQMVGRDLRLYNLDALTVDRTAQPRPVVFRKGRDISDSPRKISSRELATVLLAAGKENAGVYHEEVDATAVASRRRIEGYVSNGTITDPGTLEAFTEANLSRSVNALMEKTHGLAFANKKSPQPLRDFNVGDWCYSDVGEGLEKLRVKQWVLSMDNKGVVTGSVTLNDLIAERNARLAGRISGIVGGSTIIGESRATDVVPGELVDGLAPAVPAALGLASALYGDSQGHNWAQVTASWAQVTANTDGTVCEDLAGYRLRWRYIGQSSWQYVDSPGNDTTVSWSPVSIDTSIEVSIQAYDKAGNESPWSGSVNLDTVNDVFAPEQPSTPVADNYMGLLRLTYDGKTASGAEWAPDVDRFTVHASSVNNFIPDASTWVDTLRAAGSTYLDVGYGETRYFRIVAVDRSGNQSQPSDTAFATSSQILSGDIFDGAVGTAKLADLAVTTAKIANLAVNTAQIGSLDVGKLAAGVLNADVTLSGRIATAMAGARVELNAIGLQGFLDDGVTKWLSLTQTESLLTGTFKTALSGRRIEMGVEGDIGTVRFYSGVGGQSSVFKSATYSTAESTVEEQLGLGFDITGAHGAWNKYAASESGVMSTSGRILQFVYADVSSSSTGGFSIWRANDTAWTGAKRKFTLTGSTEDNVFFSDFNTAYFFPSAGLADELSGQRIDMMQWPDGQPTSYGTTSPSLRFISKPDSNNLIYGARLGYSQGVGGAFGTATGPTLTVSQLSTGYHYIAAAGFLVNSTADNKSEIVDLDHSALDVVRRTRPRAFRRSDQHAIRERVGKGTENNPRKVTKTKRVKLPAATEVGFIAQELPPELDGGPDSIGYNTNRVLAYAVGAIKELAAEVDALKELVGAP